MGMDATLDVRDKKALKEEYARAEKEAAEDLAKARKALLKAVSDGDKTKVKKLMSRFAHYNKVSCFQTAFLHSSLLI